MEIFIAMCTYVAHSRINLHKMLLLLLHALLQYANTLGCAHTHTGHFWLHRSHNGEEINTLMYTM